MITVQMILNLMQTQIAFCGAVLLLAIPIELAIFSILIGKRLLRQL